MKKNRAIYTILAISTLLQWQCGPKEDNGPTYYISQETKDYCFFKEGSWWKYKSNKGETDSVAVTFNERYVKIVNGNNEEFINMEMYTSSNDIKSREISPIKGNDGWLLEESWVSFFHFNDEIEVMKTKGIVNYRYFAIIVSLIQIDTFLQIGDSIYNSVKHFKVEPESGPHLYKNIWWAKNIGKVKYITEPDSTVWELIDYNIIQ